MSKAIYFFCCCLLVVLGNRHVSGEGDGTFNSPFESEFTDPATGTILFTRRWQSISDGPPIVVGDTTIHAYNIRQKEFSYLITSPQGIPIQTTFKGEWNEHTSSSRTKTDALGFVDTVRDYLESDLATVKSFSNMLGGLRIDDDYKWVHNYVNSNMDVNPTWTIGHVTANAFIDDASTVDDVKKESCFYDFNFDRNSGPGGGSWDMCWQCESPFDDFCGMQSGDWINMPGFLGTTIYQKSVASGPLTNRLSWVFSETMDDAYQFRTAASDHPAPIPAVAVTPWTQERLLRPSSFD